MRSRNRPSCQRPFMSQLVCGVARQAAKGLGLRLEAACLKRIAQPDEIANAVAFFASDAASFDRNSNGKSRCALRQT
jgi:NAD(P)-dependent dehydrogenase (short-subunit alcohol dehydrogenase family)